MTEQTNNNSGKRKSSLRSFIYGGLFTYYVLTPIIDGRFTAFYKKKFSKTTNTSFSQDRAFFNQIDGKVLQYRHYLFNKYFDKNSVSKAKEYYNLNNHANQLNPNSDAYWQSRGYDERPDNWEELISKDINQTQGNWDNYSNQLNPNNDVYWQSRGYNERPDNWQSESSSSSSNAAMDNHANQMNPNNSAYSSSRSNSGGKGGK